MRHAVVVGKLCKRKAQSLNHLNHHGGSKNFRPQQRGGMHRQARAARNLN